jgi:hypothetical protein
MKIQLLVAKSLPLFGSKLVSQTLRDFRKQNHKSDSNTSIEDSMQDSSYLLVGILEATVNGFISLSLTLQSPGRVEILSSSLEVGGAVDCGDNKSAEAVAVKNYDLDAGFFREWPLSWEWEWEWWDSMIIDGEFSLPSLLPSPLPLSIRWMTVENSERWLNQKSQGAMVPAALSSDPPNGRRL